MGSHRAPDEQPELGSPRPFTRKPLKQVDRRIRTQVHTLIAANLTVAAILTLASGGTSPALLLMQGIAPLPVWGIAGYGIAAVLLICGFPVIAHGWAIIMWFVLASGLLIGVTTGASSSPAASMAFTALVVVVLTLHVTALRHQRPDDA